MRKILLALSIGILSLTGLQGQEVTCGFNHTYEKSLKKDSSLENVFKVNEQELQRVIAHNKMSRRADEVYLIPLVVHVIHIGEAVGVGSNISDAQIHNGIAQMNAAFRNASGLGVDTKIEFKLAESDENCMAHSGINRVDGSVVPDYSTLGVELSTTNGATEDDIKALSRWSNASYYNIWVITELDDSNAGQGGSGSFTAGYAYYPGAGSNVDGTIILHSQFGGIGTAFGGTSSSLIHELGHGLNLWHVFEGDNSGADCPGAGNLCGRGNGDCCADTSPYKRTLFTCPTGTESCTGLPYDNTIKNWMDYSAKSCKVMFTEDQKARMRATMEGSRGTLLTSNGFTVASGDRTVVGAVCSGTGSDWGISGITNVQIEGALNVSSGTPSEDGGYFDGTTSCFGFAALSKGATYEFNVTIPSSSYGNQVGAWIDYNNDGDFTDAGEEIYMRTDMHGSAPKDSGNFTVPANATAGLYLRMRVVGDLDASWGVDAISSCHDATYGQTEDHLVYISTGSATDNISNASGPVFTVSPNPVSDVLNISFGGVKSNYNYSLVDASGKVATTVINSNTSSINTSGLGSGIYYLTVSNSAGTTTVKVVKAN